MEIRGQETVVSSSFFVNLLLFVMLTSQQQMVICIASYMFEKNEIMLEALSS